MTEAFELSPSEAAARDFDAVFDIRFTRSEAILPEAQAIEYGTLLAGNLALDDDAAILVICDIGLRSRTAVSELRRQGYATAWSLAGGADALRLHTATQGDNALATDTASRYDRQIKLAGFGLEGQRNLMEASVAVVGAGGLGSPVLLYLVAAGVGSITLIEPDVVDLSNLQRQPIYGTADVGRSKVAASVDRLTALNPNTSVNVIEATVGAQNATELLSGMDVIVDATDAFEARYALNAAAIVLAVPLVYGSVYGYEGQYAVFDAASGPCYRCVFPDPPTGDAVLDCATIGVLGPVTGVIGSLQSAAALQIAAKRTHGLTGTLTLYDSRTARFDRMKIAKRADCPGCGVA